MEAVVFLSLLLLVPAIAGISSHGKVGSNTVPPTTTPTRPTISYHWSFTVTTTLDGPADVSVGVGGGVGVQAAWERDEMIVQLKAQLQSEREEAGRAVARLESENRSLRRRTAGGGDRQANPSASL